MSDKVLKCGNGEALIHIADPELTNPCNMMFNDSTYNEVGRLEWGTGKLIFSGDIEESAKLFFEFLAQYFDDNVVVKRDN